MCYDALVDGDATERPVSTLLREEGPDALSNGAMAAVIVAAVLSAGGVGAATVVRLAVVAMGLGAVVHQAVLLLGVGLLRHRARDAANAGAERPV